MKISLVFVVHARVHSGYSIGRIFRSPAGIATPLFKRGVMQLGKEHFKQQQKLVKKKMQSNHDRTWS